MLNNYRSLNSFELIGHLGKDAEIAKSKSGVEYVRFSVATSCSIKKEGGGFDHSTTWHSLTWVGSRALKAAGMLTRGSLVRVCGYISYSDAQENKSKSTYLNVDSVDLLSQGKPKAEDKPAAQRTAAAEANDDFPI